VRADGAAAAAGSGAPLAPLAPLAALGGLLPGSPSSVNLSLALRALDTHGNIRLHTNDGIVARLVEPQRDEAGPWAAAAPDGPWSPSPSVPLAASWRIEVAPPAHALPTAPLILELALNLSSGGGLCGVAGAPLRGVLNATLPRAAVAPARGTLLLTTARGAGAPLPPIRAGAPTTALLRLPTLLGQLAQTSFEGGAGGAVQVAVGAAPATPPPGQGALLTAGAAALAYVGRGA
jgi:hypothetical protein